MLAGTTADAAGVGFAVVQCPEVSVLAQSLILLQLNPVHAHDQCLGMMGFRRRLAACEQQAEHQQQSGGRHRGASLTDDH
ncbi:hypothetical protein D3C71_1701870 [compost metagenome]